ncbi:MAG: hypothetical protein U5N86_00830 [Planctomycetota bacterium]|nr:hypothetical protein [Planctomycetota bacterium]
MSDEAKNALFKSIHSRAQEEGEHSDTTGRTDIKSFAQESSCETECCTVERTGHACICSSGEFAVFCDIEEWY